jgi:hypothetical protein
MRRILPSALFCAFAFTATQLCAQDHFAFAITDLTKEGAGWNALRKLDLSTGQYSNVLLNGSESSATVFDAQTKKPLTLAPDARYGTMLQSPFSTGVAAAAYDRKHNRLYFTPMFVDQLRYIDLKTMKVYYVAGQAFAGMGNMHNDEAKIITRMVIAPDGNGYAISNDGNTFIRFSTGKKPTIEQLGALVDDPANNGISVHNRCTSFGGDMVADDRGNFYIISARNHVFRVNAETKTATHVAGITKLPSNFTVNGAVVDAEGALLVSSAVDGSAYYVVNTKDWSAAPYQTAAGIYRSSDLANSNFLATQTTTRSELKNVQIAKSNLENKYTGQISVYPNPVTDNNITLSFARIPAGDYTLELTDIVGRRVMQQRVVVQGEGQTQNIALKASDARGTYLLRIVDRSKQTVFSQKVLVQ